jgi:hypothetical protein
MAGGNSPGTIGSGIAPMVIDSGTLALTQSAPPGVIGLAGGSAGNQAAPAAVAPKVLQTAQSVLGQTVGDGQCFALADRALRNAGAKSAGDFKPVVPDDDYVWGTQATPSDVKPGDVIQFRDFLFKKTVVETAPDGSKTTTTDPIGVLRDHHTAIVESIDKNGLVTVLEQNMPPGSSVHRSKIPLADTSFESGNKETSFDVTGQIWVYHPIGK